MKHGPILDKNTLSNSSVLMISLRYMGFEQRTCVHQHNPVATAESSPLKNNGKQLKDRCNQFNLFITTRNHDLLASWHATLDHAHHSRQSSRLSRPTASLALPLDSRRDLPGEISFVFIEVCVFSFVTQDRLHHAHNPVGLVLHEQLGSCVLFTTCCCS